MAQMNIPSEMTLRPLPEVQNRTNLLRLTKQGFSRLFLRLILEDRFIFY